jgi:hypothetical protein
MAKTATCDRCGRPCETKTFGDNIVHYVNDRYDLTVHVQPVRQEINEDSDYCDDCKRAIVGEVLGLPPAPVQP